MSKFNLLLDADVLAYAASSVSQNEVDWGGGDITIEGNLPLAQQSFESQVVKYTTMFETEKFQCIWSVGANYRKTILPTYKEMRVLKPKPVDYKPLMAWAMEKYPSMFVDTLEGDDVMGIMSTQEPNKHIIISIDKDMFTIPGRFHRIKKSPDKAAVLAHAGHLKNSTPEEAQRFFLTQVLMGDKTDNYDGVPGIGPKKAEAWLETNGYTWDSIVACYKSKGLTEEDAIVQARCARIMTVKEWNDGDIKLWDPSHLI